MCHYPASGFLHFYRAEEVRRKFSNTRVNALLRAFSISTKEEKFDTFEQIVSMPCFGLSPFLQYKDAISNEYYVCVNALLRAFSISTSSILKYSAESQGCVNALLRAFSISTIWKKWKKSSCSDSVNALLRAFSISTVPLRNPSVYAASQPHFCK